MSHGLPNPPAEPAADTSLDGLAPRFRSAVLVMLSTNADYMVAESLRTPERQAWLYGFGREYDDGRGVVTQAPTNLTTWHGYGLAVDIVSKAHGWDAPPSFWANLGMSAQAAGLSWGGAWPRFQDRPHCQWGPPMRQAPSQHAAELMASGGMEAVWKEVGAN